MTLSNQHTVAIQTLKHINNNINALIHDIHIYIIHKKCVLHYSTKILLLKSAFQFDSMMSQTCKKHDISNTNKHVMRSIKIRLMSKKI